MPGKAVNNTSTSRAFQALTVMATVYESLDEMDSKSAQAIEALLYEDEDIEYAILGKVPWLVKAIYLFHPFYKRFYHKLLLTDRRILAFKRGWFREKSTDYTLDEITSIEYTKGIFTGKINIQGAGFEESYKTPTETGREFVTLARKHLTGGEEATTWDEIDVLSTLRQVDPTDEDQKPTRPVSM